MPRGHLRQRAKGSWSIVIELEADPETGKRRQKWYTFHGPKKKAQEELTRLLRERDQGTLITDPTTWTVAEFLRHWLEAYAAQHVRPKTLALYRSIVAKRILSTLGKTPLARLNSAQLRDLYARLSREGRPGGKPLSASSVRAVHVLLHQALGHALKWQMVPRNVAEGVEPPRLERPTMRVWNAEEARRFLTAVLSEDVSPYSLALAFALETGVRQGELLGLRWRDVDMAGATVQIVQTVGRVPGSGLQVGPPKTSRSRRRIEIAPALVELLKAHKARQNIHRLQLGLEWKDNDLVFCTGWGKPIDPKALYNAFHAASVQAGVPRMRFHDLRHTHATLLLLQGVHAKIVSERLGHGSIAITSDLYSHMLPGMQSTAVDKLDELLRPPEARR